MKILIVVFIVGAISGCANGQLLPKETLKKTSISGEIHASHELNG